MARITTATLRQRKADGAKIAVLTAYDYPSAKIMDASGVDILLVGDSCAMTVMGEETTLGMTMNQMVHHTKMVARAAGHAMVVADMPFLSYQVSPREALLNAGRLVAEAGAQAVKLEGPADRFGEAITAIVNAGIPVMGHLGLTPQSVHQMGGYKVQGRDPEGRERLKREALELERYGCFSLVLECVPATLAAEITQSLTIPAIGIGAGAACDGQVLVSHDMLGLGRAPKFSKQYADLGAIIGQAVAEYVRDVKEGHFPGPEHEFE